MTRARPPFVRYGLLALATAVAPLLAVPALSAEAAPAATVPPSDAAPAARDIWTPTGAAALRSADPADLRVDPVKFAAYDLDLGALDGALAKAPNEASKGSLFSVPAPTGDLVDFRIVSSPVMESGLAAAHPEITTYAGRSVDGAATIRLDVTPMGFHASVRGDGASWYVDPAYNGKADGPYLSYLGTDLPKDSALVEPEEMAHELEQGNEAAEGAKPAGGQRAGEAQGGAVTIRTYRLALLTDPSYARYFGTANVLAEKVTLMNRVNQIYNDDFAIRLLMIDGTDRLNIDTDAKAFGPDGGCGSAGCFTTNQFASGCTGGLLNRNRIALGQLVGASNYDIGHVMLGINGGGVAGLGVVGGDGKARGCTGLPQPEGDFMAIDYVAHEMGHQFGGNHTFNGTQLNCGGNKAAPSVEPGSGSSVMAYAGICRQDDLQPHTDPYFSQWSQQEMTAYVTSARNPINDVQTISLNGFDTDGESFTLTYNGATTSPIERGVNYTTAAIDAALEAILPAGSLVTVAAFGGSGALTDTGFQVTFTGTGSPLTGTNVDPLTIALTGTGLTGFVGETAKGGPIQNAGFVTEEATNHTPVVTAPATATIPLRTPFALTGSATDPDNDQMIYLWEQTDRGAGTGTSLVSQTKTNGPLFRVFGTYANVTPAGTLLINSPGENIANGNPTRTFPDMEQILVNNTNGPTGLCPDAPAAPTTGGSNVPIPTRDCFSEWLPTIDYVGSTQAANDNPLSLNFRFTARDLDPIAGGYSFANTKVLVDNTAGPFLVSSKNVAAAAVAGRSEVVSWAVAGTNKPTLAENVKISLSTDGGRTFPIVLAESTPNDGSEPVVWPNVATTTARIKVEAVGNVFFDVNDADFQIVPRFTVTGPSVATTTVDYSDPITPVTFSAESGAGDGPTLAATADGLPEGLTLAKTASSAAGVLPGTATFEVSGTVTDEPGTYPVTVEVSDGSTTTTKTFTVVVEAEDATVAYTGPAASTVGADQPVAITASVTEAADGTLGDLTTATVTFTDTVTDEVLCADAAVTAAGVATCSFTPTVTGSSRTYAIGLTVGGSYTGASAADAPYVVTIEEPDTEAPETTITAAPSSVLLSTSATVTATSEAGATFACTLDGTAVPCAGGTATLTGLVPGTHVFTAAASDAAGNTDPTPASTTFTVAFDDRGLRLGTRGWARITGTSAYQRTLTTTRTAGARMTFDVEDATAILLVARRQADAGTVRVYLGDTLLRTMSLASATTEHQKVFNLGALPGGTASGTVRIESVNAKQVAIDGLVVATATS